MTDRELARIWGNEIIFGIASTICLVAYIWQNAGQDRWSLALLAYLLCNLRLHMLVERDKKTLVAENANVVAINKQNVALNEQLRENIIDLADQNDELERRLQADVEYLAKLREPPA